MRGRASPGRREEDEGRGGQSNQGGSTTNQPHPQQNSLSSTSHTSTYITRHSPLHHSKSELVPLPASNRLVANSVRLSLSHRPLSAQLARDNSHQSHPPPSLPQLGTAVHRFAPASTQPKTSIRHAALVAAKGHQVPTTTPLATNPSLSPTERALTRTLRLSSPPILSRISLV